MPETLWIDAQTGAAGDMLLAAAIDLGADAASVEQTLCAWLPQSATLTVHAVRRAGLRATQCTVDAPSTPSPPRDLAAVLALLDVPGLPAAVAAFARRVFTDLATAEASVHGIAVDEVHFHEVGAWDSIADIVGSAVALEQLGLLGADVTVSTVAVGSGRVRTEHGSLPVPAPATVAVLAAAGAATLAGPIPHEACTPTGAALLAALAQAWGPQPAMTVTGVGVGAGGRDAAEAPNVLRLFRGRPAGTAGVVSEAMRQLEATVDDLDPRAWPEVLDHLVAAGARDAWLTPALMRKGRPGHVVAAIVPEQSVAGVRTALFVHTTTLGVRELPATRTSLPRRTISVTVDGTDIAVKIGELDGVVVTVQPEYSDAVNAARLSGRAVHDVLRAAEHEARQALARS